MFYCLYMLYSIFIFNDIIILLVCLARTFASEGDGNGRSASALFRPLANDGNVYQLDDIGAALS